MSIDRGYLCRVGAEGRIISAVARRPGHIGYVGSDGLPEDGLWGAVDPLVARLQISVGNTVYAGAPGGDARLDSIPMTSLGKGWHTFNLPVLYGEIERYSIDAFDKTGKVIQTRIFTG